MRIPARLKKYLFVFLLLAFCFSIFASSRTFASSETNYNQTPVVNSPAETQQTAQPNLHAAPNTNPDVPKNLHTWTQNVMIEVMSAAICQLSGIDPINPNQGCLGVDSATNKIGFITPSGDQSRMGGAIGFLDGMIATLYTPPLRTGDYFNYLAQNFGIAKPAHAQGLGFDGLKPLMGLWTIMRNIVYLLFIAVFIVIGLAIMLRVKIDPRTVMTIENQIPKIIIALILVTFSFAIAGFLVDLMYVAIYLIYSLIAGLPGMDVRALDPGLMQGKTAVEAAGGMAAGGIAGITYNVAGSLKTVMQSLLGVQGCPDPGTCLNALFNPLNFMQDIIGSSTGTNFNAIELVINIVSGVGAFSIFQNIASISKFDVLGVPVGQILGYGGGIPLAIASYGTFQYLAREILPFLIIYLIILVAIIWALFRLWIQLLSAYVFILLDVFLAPFFIVTGVFPGGLGIGGWLRDIVANLSAFPVTIGMFLVGKVLMEDFSKNGNAFFTPPLIGNPTPYAGDASPIGSLIGLGVLLLTPQVVTMMKEAIKAPQFKYTVAIGQAIGVGPGVVGGAFTALGSPYGALANLGHLKKQFTGEGALNPASIKKGIGAVYNRVVGPPKEVKSQSS